MSRTKQPAARTRSAPADPIDVSFMYAVHDAFQRDLDRLVAMADAGDAPGAALRAGWDRFTTFLQVHHTAEDTHLWPVLAGRVADGAVLEQMEDEHNALDRLLDGVDAALSGPAPALAARAAELAQVLTAHCDHEEELALPLVQKHLTKDEWDAFGAEQRSRLGMGGAATFFPWLLDGAPDETRRKVLGIVPPPVRLLYRAVWRPRYERAPRWQTPASA
ncbi:hemerythrin domain-containing protein [Actinomadura verrucosospora]|uniref:Hemerythrin hhE cation binding domain-containing protein n=1 Tax=Actinomadura verrucosospora TaxID=46165 RepID=A0A7D3VST8_ACTVE|nr:hemerythrin domain-containing protein [Actinomadura verrucosospora]QKG21750.1 hemerythrin hhE cation binding domain-containing protein [Actinomadura verrucosospora]